VESVSNIIKNRLAVTLSLVIAEIGPVPDNCGDLIRRILSSHDEIILICLGCALEECLKHGNYDSLRKSLDEIPLRGI
jgi:hypothetical protein